MRSIFAVCLLGLSSVASAEEEFVADWYVGAGVTHGAIDGSLAGFPFDGDDNGWQLLMGYQASPNVGIEFGYLAGGEARDVVGGLSATIESTAFIGRIIGTLPFPGGFSLHGTLGVSRWDADSRLGGLQGDDNGTDPTFGAGAGFRHGQSVFRLNYERADIDTFDVELFTLTVLFMI